jgi:hypothetical protein
MRGKQAKILSDDNLEDLLLVAESSVSPTGEPSSSSPRRGAQLRTTG